jgi:hypothetical protein
MHLFITSQPTLVTYLWWFCLQDIEPYGLFGGFLVTSNSNWESSPPFDKTSSLGEFLSVIYPQNLSCRPLIWNLADLSPRASLSKVVWRYSTFMPTLSQGEWIHCNLEDTRDRHVAINFFQWPLLGHYLLEVYLAPYSLDSRCASHALLVIK